MKRPKPDIGDVIKATFVNDIGGARKLKRLWGTTLVNGIEVLVRRNYYHPTNMRSSSFEKLFKYLNAYDDVTTSSKKGIDNAWIYINKNKADSAISDILSTETYKDFVSSNLNKMWWDPADGVVPDNLTLTTSIVVENEFSSLVTYTDSEGNLSTRLDESLRPSRYLSTAWDKATIISTFMSNYESIWNTCKVSQQGVGIINKGSITDPVYKTVVPDEDDLSPNDPWLATLARYALRPGSNVAFTVKDVAFGYQKSIEGSLCSTYVFDIEIPRGYFTPSSDVVDKIVTDLKGTYPTRIAGVNVYTNAYYTKQGIFAMGSKDLETDPTIVTRDYRLIENEDTTVDPFLSSIWYWHEGVPYVKADALHTPRNYNLTYKTVYSYLLNGIDTDYKKKKVPWWKKALAIVVVAISIWAMRPDLGVGLAAAIVVASIVTSLLAIGFAEAGEDEWGQAFAETTKDMDPLVTVAGIYLVVTGIANIAEEIAKKGLEQYLKDQALDLVKDVVKGVTDVGSGTVSAASVNLTGMLVQLVTLHKKNELERVGDRNRDLQAEYDKLQKESSQENDLLRGFARIYAKPATADWSMYAATYDLPYERGGGALALGNVQRTTKQAMRKATYDDPVFENILLM